MISASVRSSKLVNQICALGHGAEHRGSSESWVVVPQPQLEADESDHVRRA